MTDERWLPIPGFEGAYEVSDLGRIWSHLSCRMLKAPPNNHGYLIIVLTDARRGRPRRTYALHTLVALAFLGPRPAGMEVRHLDGVRANCWLDNLAYGTGIDNEADKKRHGTHEKSRRTLCPLDHQLVAPNLVLGALKRGQRNCMACARGRSTVSHAAKRGVVIDLKIEADRHYHSIMGQAVGATTGA